MSKYIFIVLCALLFSINSYACDELSFRSDKFIKTKPIQKSELNDLLSHLISFESHIMCNQKKGFNARLLDKNREISDNLNRLESGGEISEEEENKILMKVEWLKEEVADISARIESSNKNYLGIDACKLTESTKVEFANFECKATIVDSLGREIDYLKNNKRMAEASLASGDIDSINNLAGVENGSKLIEFEGVETIYNELNLDKGNKYSRLVLSALESKSSQEEQFKLKQKQINDSIDLLVDKYVAEGSEIFCKDENKKYYIIDENPIDCISPAKIKQLVDRSRSTTYDDRWIQNKNIESLQVDMINELNEFGKISEGGDVHLEAKKKVLFKNINAYLNKYVGSTRFNVAAGAGVYQAPPFRLNGAGTLDISAIDSNLTGESLRFFPRQAFNGLTEPSLAISAYSPLIEIEVHYVNVENTQELDLGVDRPFDTGDDTPTYLINSKLNSKYTLDYDLKAKIGWGKITRFFFKRDYWWIPNNDKNDFGVGYGFTSLNVEHTYSSTVRRQSEVGQSYSEIPSSNEYEFLEVNRYSLLTKYFSIFYQFKISDQVVVDVEWKDFRDEKNIDQEKIYTTDETISASVKYIWF